MSLRTACLVCLLLCCLFRVALAAPPPSGDGDVFPSAAYGTEWLALQPGQIRAHTHSIGGDVGLMVVDLHMYDATPGGLGVHRWAYGGVHAAGREIGAYWQNLTSDQITISRASDDGLCDYYALRVWQMPMQPAYDSGWVAVEAGGTLSLTHSLGGDPDYYGVSLKFRNPQGGKGVNLYAAGGMDLYGLMLGGAYEQLDNESVTLVRHADDLQAEEMRLVILGPDQMSAADYDSGWIALAPGATQVLTHSVGMSPGDMAVRMAQRSPEHGINVHAVGGLESNGDYMGSTWQNLTQDTITVRRMGADPYAEMVRVRIWGYEPGVQPQLISPEDGALLDNGCDSQTNTRNWPFQWEAVPGATRYHLLVVSPDPAVMDIEQMNLTDTLYDYRSPYPIENDYLWGWTWQVRAEVDGAWGAWSTPRGFHVEPNNTDCYHYRGYVPMVVE